VQAAGERALRQEREFLLPVLERYKLPEDAEQGYIASMRRKVGS
jgi:hypothetical protein